MFAELHSAKSSRETRSPRYLAHTRANKAALLCGPAFCARIPRVRSALPPSPPPPPWFNGTARTMQFYLYGAIAVTIAVTLSSLRSHYRHDSTAIDGRPRFDTFERF